MTQAINTLFDLARANLAQGRLTAADLDNLQRATAPANLRQRILYLHVKSLAITSPVLNATLYEPDPDSATQLDPSAAELPYQNVKQAILDGWRVVQFPDQRAPFDDREIDILGYEFILEKLVWPPSP
jgi:hypothetical protein